MPITSSSTASRWPPRSRRARRGRARPADGPVSGRCAAAARSSAGRRSSGRRCWGRTGHRRLGYGAGVAKRLKPAVAVDHVAAVGLSASKSWRRSEERPGGRRCAGAMSSRVPMGACPGRSKHRRRRTRRPAARRPGTGRRWRRGWRGRGRSAGGQVLAGHQPAQPAGADADAGADPGATTGRKEPKLGAVESVAPRPRPG